MRPGTGSGGGRGASSDATEKQIQNQVLEAFAGRHDLRLWRANAGVARTLDSARVVRFGIPGQADLSGILRDGRRLEIEVKTEHGAQSEQQRAFQTMIERFGGVYVLARSAGDAVSQVNDALTKGVGHAGT